MESKSALVSVKDYEERAKEILHKREYNIFRAGATMESTLRENESAFSNWYIIPRIMTDVSKRNMETTILGHKVSLPFGISPFAFQKVADNIGEVSVARAAAKRNIVYTLPLMASTTIEEVAEKVPDGIKFFQVYMYANRTYTKSWIERAEKSGYKAIVLTVDGQNYGIKYDDYRNSFKVTDYKLANYDKDLLEKVSVNYEDAASNRAKFVSELDFTLNWKDIGWLRSITKLPIILKGILSPRDAEIAVEYGIDAIWVSNHGGRQLDGVPATINVLPHIVKAVNKRCEIYIDCGFRSISDVYKALALGANMVFFGRPILWALTCEGQKGVDNLLSLFSDELDIAMTLSGCNSIQDIDREKVVHRQDLFNYNYSFDPPINRPFINGHTTKDISLNGNFANGSTRNGHIGNGSSVDMDDTLTNGYAINSANRHIFNYVIPE